MSNLIPIVAPADIAQMHSALREELPILPGAVELPSTPLTARITLSYGASRLIAAGSSNKSGRTRVMVLNLGPCQIRINGSSSTEGIMETGLPIEPGQTVIFNISSDASIYGRSMGYKTFVEVTEA